jgi:hypothetical protein
VNRNSRAIHKKHVCIVHKTEQYGNRLSANRSNEFSSLHIVKNVMETLPLIALTKIYLYSRVFGSLNSVLFQVYPSRCYYYPGSYLKLSKQFIRISNQCYVYSREIDEPWMPFDSSIESARREKNSNEQRKRKWVTHCEVFLHGFE